MHLKLSFVFFIVKKHYMNVNGKIGQRIEPKRENGKIHEEEYHRDTGGLNIVQ